MLTLNFHSSSHIAIGTDSEIIVLKKCADKFIEEKRLKGHIEDVNTCSFSMDGKYLVSGGKDKTVRLWDLELSECIKIIGRHETRVINCELSADGKQIISLDEEIY